MSPGRATAGDRPDPEDVSTATDSHPSSRPTVDPSTERRQPHADHRGRPRLSTPSGHRDLLNDSRATDPVRREPSHISTQHPPSPARARPPVRTHQPHGNERPHVTTQNLPSVRDILEDTSPMSNSGHRLHPPPYSQGSWELSSQHERFAYNLTGESSFSHAPRHDPPTESEAADRLEPTLSPSLSPSRAQGDHEQSIPPGSMNSRRRSFHQSHRPSVDQRPHRLTRSTPDAVLMTRPANARYHPYQQRPPSEPGPSRPTQMSRPTHADRYHPYRHGPPSWPAQVPAPAQPRDEPEVYVVLYRPHVPRIDTTGWTPDQLQKFGLGFEECAGAVQLLVNGHLHRHPRLVEWHSDPTQEYDERPQRPSARTPDSESQQLPSPLRHRHHRARSPANSLYPPISDRLVRLPPAPIYRPQTSPPTRPGFGPGPPGPYLGNHYYPFITQPDTSGVGPGRGRRQEISCYSCRDKKLGCDDGNPCKQCVKRGTPNECERAAYVRRRGKGKKNKSGSDGSESMSGGSDWDVRYASGESQAGPSRFRLCSDESPEERKQEQVTPMTQSVTISGDPSEEPSSRLEERDWTMMDPEVREVREEEEERENEKEQEQEQEQEDDMGRQDKGKGRARSE